MGYDIVQYDCMRAGLHPNLPLIWTVNNFALFRIHCKDIQPRSWLRQAKAGAVRVKGLHSVLQLHQFVCNDILRLSLLNILQDDKHLAELLVGEESSPVSLVHSSL